MKKLAISVLALLLVFVLALSVSAASASALYPSEKLIASGISEAEAATLFAKAQANAARFKTDFYPMEHLKQDFSVEETLKNYKIVDISTSTGYSSDGSELFITSYRLEPKVGEPETAADEATVMRYTPCPVGSGQCHTNDFLSMDAIADANGKVRYYVLHYGCGMCGGVDHSEVVWPS